MRARRFSCRSCSVDGRRAGQLRRWRRRFHRRHPPVTTTPTGPTWTAGVFQPHRRLPRSARRLAAATILRPAAMSRSRGQRARREILAALVDQRSVPLVLRGARSRSRADVRHADYFDLLKTTATTASGQRERSVPLHVRHHTWQQPVAVRQRVRLRRQLGVRHHHPAAPARRRVRGSGSPARRLASSRGTEVLSIDGVDLVNDNTTAGVNKLNAGLSPTANGQAHTFVLRDRGGARAHGLADVHDRDRRSPCPSVESSPAGRLHAVQRSHRDLREAARRWRSTH